MTNRNPIPKLQRPQPVELVQAKRCHSNRATYQVQTNHGVAVQNWDHLAIQMKNMAAIVTYKRNHRMTGSILSSRVSLMTMLHRLLCTASLNFRSRTWRNREGGNRLVGLLQRIRCHRNLTITIMIKRIITVKLITVFSRLQRPMTITPVLQWTRAKFTNKTWIIAAIIWFKVRRSMTVQLIKERIQVRAGWVLDGQTIKISMLDLDQSLLQDKTAEDIIRFTLQRNSNYDISSSWMEEDTHRVTTIW